MQNATWLVSRELAEAAGPWDTRLQYDQDGEYYCRVLLGLRRYPIRARSQNFLSSLWYEPNKLYWQLGRKEKLADSLHAIAYGISAFAGRERTCSKSLCEIYADLVSHVSIRKGQISWPSYRAWPKNLGGRLEIPQLPWKYAWIRSIFGWKAAKMDTACSFGSKSFFVKDMGQSNV